MTTPDMEVIKDIPGYKVILKAVIKSQIQQLVEQLASSTEEESVILTASVADGTLCHLGSSSGKVFLEDHEDIKSQFLGFCLKHHHKQKLEKERKEAQEKEEALARSMQPMFGDPSFRQRSPRFPSPGQPNMGPMSRISPARMRSPGIRHQPYPVSRPHRPRLNFDPVTQSPAQMASGTRPVGPNRIDGQVIKIEPEDNDGSDSMPAGTSAVESSQPSSPSVKPSTPSQGQAASDNDDARSESSNSTIPNEASDLKLPASDANPPGGLSLDSDLSSIIPDVNKSESVDSGNTSGLDPNVSVKLEAAGDSEMDLEITGVELGHRPPVPEPSGSQEWMSNVQDFMQGASGNPGDMSGQQGFNKMVQKFPRKMRAQNNECSFCSRAFRSKSDLNRHMRIHTGLKPHSCHVCGRAFSRKDNLRTHMISHMKL